MPEETIDPPAISFRDALKAGANADPNNPHKDKEDAAPVVPDKPVPVVPDKPATPPVDPDEEIISGKRSPKSDDFKRVKTAAKAAREEADSHKSKLSEYEKELADLRKNAKSKTNDDEIKKVLAERDQYKSQFEVFALETMPEFNNKYGARQERVIESLKQSLSPEVLAKAQQLIGLPESPQKQRLIGELLEEVSPYEAGEITAANREMRSIITDRNSELSNAHSKMKEIVESRQKQHAERQGQMEKLFDAEAEKAMAEDPLYKLKEGDSKEVVEWNESVKEARQVAKAIFSGGLKPEEMAHNSLKIARHHVLVGELKNAHARIAELDGVVKKIQGSGPELGGTGRGEPASEGKSFKELMAQAARRG